MAIQVIKAHNPHFSPAKKEIDRGEYRGYGYVVGDDDDARVLFIFQNKDLANITVFVGEDTVLLKDSRGVERSLEIPRRDDQMVFCCKYEGDVSLEKVIADVAVFVDAIEKKIGEYIRYCMTHDD